MHQVLGNSLRNHSVRQHPLSPSSDFLEKEKERTRRCTSFGEAASAISILVDIAHFFKGFYNGFAEESTIWFAYDEDNEFELPYKF